MWLKCLDTVDAVILPKRMVHNNPIEISLSSEVYFYGSGTYSKPFFKIVSRFWNVSQQLFGRGSLVYFHEFETKRIFDRNCNFRSQNVSDPQMLGAQVLSGRWSRTELFPSDLDRFIPCMNVFQLLSNRGDDNVIQTQYYAAVLHLTR